jgi:hypothetical protein
MKLLLCKKCQDIFKLQDELKYCNCKESSGKYLDKLNAVYSGPCIPIGIDNRSLLQAIKNQPLWGFGYEFTAFVIAKTCDTFTRIERNK